MGNIFAPPRVIAANLNLFRIRGIRSVTLIPVPLLITFLSCIRNGHELLGNLCGYCMFFWLIFNFYSSVSRSERRIINKHFKTVLGGRVSLGDISRFNYSRARNVECCADNCGIVLHIAYPFVIRDTV